MKSKVKRIVALLCATVLVATTFFGHWYTRQAEAATDVEPVFPDGYEYLTIKDFKDADTSVALTPGTGTSTDYTRYNTTACDSFEKVLLSMKVTFAAGTSATRLEVGGIGKYSGLRIYPSDETGSQLRVRSCPLDGNGYYGQTDGYQTLDITTTEAGVEKFVGEEFILQLAFDFGETDSSTGKADLTLDVYINGNLAKSCSFTGCNMAKFGNYLNFVNGVNITYDNVLAPIEPVFLNGFDNLTISDFVNGSGTKMAEGEYVAGDYYDYSATGLTNFDKKLISMNVTFKGGTWANSIVVGGTTTWKGFNIHPKNSEDGSQLVIDETWAGDIIDKDTYAPLTLDAATAGLDSFLNNEFLLQMSFEYGEEVDGIVDLKLGIYIDGKLYNNEILTIENCTKSALGNHMAVYCSVAENGGKSIIIGEEVKVPVEPVTLDGFDNLTISDFVNDSGTKMAAKEYVAGDYYDYSATGLTNFDKKLISMNVTFKGGTWANSIVVGGTTTWKGFNIHPKNSEDGSQLVIDETWAGDIIDKDTYAPLTLDAATAGLDSFLNNEFLLQMSFEYGEEVDGIVDLKLGIYIDGKLYNNEILTIENCTKSALGNHMAVYCSVAESGGKSIIIGKEVVFPTVPEEPVDPFEGYEEVTIKDFVDGSGNVMEEKAYSSENDGDFTLANHPSFDKKVLSMNVKFKEGSYTTRLDVAGSAQYKGFMVFPTATGDKLRIQAGSSNSGTEGYQVIDIGGATAGVSNFINTEFLLQLTFDFGTVDSSNKANLTLGVYINGELCKDLTITGCNMGNFGSHMGLYCEGDTSIIIVGSVNEDFPADSGIQPSGRYEKITFGQFGILDGTYPRLSDLAVTGTAIERTTLDKTVICGDIFLEGSNDSQIIWGGQTGWNGLRMFPSASGTMRLVWYEGNDTTTIATLDSTTAGVAFVGEKYNIMLSSELVDAGGDGSVNDIKIGIWFNGVLYNQQYFYATDLGDKYGNRFAVYCGAEGDKVTLGSVPELLIQPSEELKKVSYNYYGIEDGEYTETKGALKTQDTVAGTVLCGDIELTITGAQYCQIVLGGNSDSAWNGIRLLTNSADKFNVMWYEGSTSKYIGSVEASKAGVDFNGEKFELIMSTELIDNDGDGKINDIKFGIWFNGFLYQNQYFIIADKGELLGNYFLVSSEHAILGSIPEVAKLPDESFDKITFSDFGLETQEVACDSNVVAQGTASEYTTLDKVVFSGDFRMSEDGNYQIIYGGNSWWDGLRVMISSNVLNVSWYKADEDPQCLIYITDPTTAGVTSFAKNTFNLKISTELVDADGDGNKNDIKVGVWIDNILCEYNGNDYHVVKDWGDQLLNGFSIYGDESDEVQKSVLIRNDVEYQSNLYYYEDISSFRQTTGYTYPTLEGYVFGGWYADAEYTEWLGTDVTSGDAWAKFVEEDILSAKTQVKVDSNGKVTSGSTSLRLATTVDSLQYRKISFYLQKQKDGTYGNEVDAATLSNEDGRLVYEKLYYIGSNTETMSYKPNAFSWQSAYFKTFTLTDIPESDYGVMIKATPFWVTMDGTIVRGKTLETCVSNYEPMGTNTSTAVSVDFLGESVMPITGYFGPYMISDTSDPLLLPDYNTDTYFKMIADSGVNVLSYSSTDYASHPDYVIKQLELGEKYGVGIYVNDSSIKTMSESEMLAQIKNYSGYKSFCGMYLVDEPGTSDYCSTEGKNVSDYSNAAAILSKNNIPYYSNMYPVLDAESAWWEGIFGSAGIDDTDKEAYLSYIEEYYKGLNPEVISYDYYPFSDTRLNEDGSVNQSLYFWNLDAVRDKARATGKPFWTFVQAGSQWNDASNYFESNTPYYPTEGQFMWNANTALAFGTQGIQYFPVVQPKHFAYGKDETHWDFNRNGLIGAWGNKTQWYDYAQSLNEHIAAIDGVLMNSYSKQIIAIGNATSATSGLTDVTTTASYNNVLTNATGNALIGCFDYCGKIALYVVNYDYANAGDVTLTFNSAKNITKIDNAVTTETSASTLTLNMEAGEGILLVIE